LFLSSRPRSSSLEWFRIAIIWVVITTGLNIQAQNVPAPPAPVSLTNSIPPPPGRGLAATNAQLPSASGNNAQAGPLTPFDPIERSLAADVAFYRSKLDNSALLPNQRKTYENILAQSQFLVADHQTNAQLWADYIASHRSKDPERIAQSESRLAAYLAARLGQIQQKQYPTNISLEAILKQFKQ